MKFEWRKWSDPLDDREEGEGDAEYIAEPEESAQEAMGEVATYFETIPDFLSHGGYIAQLMSGEIERKVKSLRGKDER